MTMSRQSLQFFTDVPVLDTKHTNVLAISLLFAKVSILDIKYDNV